MSRCPAPGCDCTTDPARPVCQQHRTHVPRPVLRELVVNYRAGAKPNQGYRWALLRAAAALHDPTPTEGTR